MMPVTLYVVDSSDSGLTQGHRVRMALKLTWDLAPFQSLYALVYIHCSYSVFYILKCNVRYTE